MIPTYEKVKELTDKQGISVNKLEEVLGYSRNTIHNMKKSTPNSERVSELADYFNVSTDYLLGRTNNPNIASDININESTNNVRDNIGYFDAGNGSISTGNITFNNHKKDKIDKLHDLVVEELGLESINMEKTEVDIHKLLIEYHRSMANDSARMRQMFEILIQQNKDLLAIVQAMAKDK